MNRSAGVTVIAVLSLLGSLLTLAMGIIVGVVMAFVPRPDTAGIPGSPIFFKMILVMTALMYVLPAIWGICTSIGLFRLKNWARISIIVFSVLLIVMSVFSGLMALVIPMPPSPQIDAAAITAMHIFMASFASFMVGIGIWWLVFFTRPKVKIQFVPAAAMTIATLPTQEQNQLSGTQTLNMAAPRPRRPVSITIIACFLLLGCIFIPLSIAMHSPAIFLTRLLTGRSATWFFLAFAAIQLYTGIGLLRLNPTARLVGIAYTAFGFINSGIFFLTPGASARISAMMEMQRSMFPWMGVAPGQPQLQFDMTPFLIIGAIGGLALISAQMYFLITRKPAFENVTAANVLH